MVMILYRLIGLRDSILCVVENLVVSFIALENPGLLW